MTNKYTLLSRKIFVFYTKRKIKNIVVLDVRSAAHLEAFLIKQGVLFLQVSIVWVVQRGVRVRSHASYVGAWKVIQMITMDVTNVPDDTINVHIWKLVEKVKKLVSYYFGFK